MSTTFHGDENISLIQPMITNVPKGLRIISWFCYASTPVTLLLGTALVTALAEIHSERLDVLQSSALFLLSEIPLLFIFQYLLLALPFFLPIIGIMIFAFVTAHGLTQGKQSSKNTVIVLCGLFIISAIFGILEGRFVLNLPLLIAGGVVGSFLLRSATVAAFFRGVQNQARTVPLLSH